MKQKRINHIIETIQKVTAGDYSKRIKISKKREESQNVSNE